MLIGSVEGEAGDAATRRAGTIDPRLVFYRLLGTTRDVVLGEFAARIAALRAIADAAELTRRLVKREQDGCTGVGHGIGIPHCRLDGLETEVVAFATTAHPIDFGALDGVPVDLIFLVASPTLAAAAHLQAVARVSRLLRQVGLAEALRAARDRDELVAVLRDAEARALGGETS